jgi:hypothetical protein
MFNILNGYSTQMKHWFQKKSIVLFYFIVLSSIVWCFQLIPYINLVFTRVVILLCISISAYIIFFKKITVCVLLFSVAFILSGVLSILDNPEQARVMADLGYYGFIVTYIIWVWKKQYENK